MPQESSTSSLVAHATVVSLIGSLRDVADDDCRSSDSCVLYISTQVRAKKEKEAVESDAKREAEYRGVHAVYKSAGSCPPPLPPSLASICHTWSSR